MGKIIQNKDIRKTIIYTRVLSSDQKDDLKNQVVFLKEFANAKGIVVDEILEDIGSGLNYNRKKWNKLLEDCTLGLIKTVIVAHKDRFIRFGYEWFERFLKSNGVEIIVVNNETLSPEAEMVQELVNIIHVFSCRIYGLRKYKKKSRRIRKLLRAYKTEINPMEEQRHKINQNIGVCRYLYNFYLAKNKELYNQFKDGLIDKKQAFMSANEFDKFINNEVKTQEEFAWITECGSKARKKAICNAETAFKRFFKEQSKFPNFKKKKNQGIGIDLEIKDLAIVNTIELPFKNINKTKEVKKLEKKLKREQIKLSRKYESLKVRTKKIKKEGGNATRQNISKQIVMVQKLHQKLSYIRNNYVNQVVNEMVKTKPSYITIEDLNVKGMMKNKHLAKAVAQQNFYGFRVKLTFKCKINNIELRVVDRWYPSSKTCSDCGSIKKDLKLSDRMYVCPVCGLMIDRDKNASVNLANAKIYKVA